MIVLKFGGTSVGTSESLKNVLQIVKQHSKHSAHQTVVVSALGGVTNKLVQVADLAEKTDSSYTQTLEEIKDRHLTLCEDLIPTTQRKNTITTINVLLNELDDICRGVFLIQELSPRTSDHILSFGERLSSAIIKDFISSNGLDVQLLDPRKFIKTDAQYGNAVVDQALTKTNIEKIFSSPAQVSLVPGFIASSNKKEHTTTTLGRGGSDYTASLIAASLQAKKLQIWTDVSGMMTANPNIVSLAHPITHLSYEEAMELSHFGAKVIYPPTIQPVLDR